MYFTKFCLDHRLDGGGGGGGAPREGGGGGGGASRLGPGPTKKR